MRRIHLGHVRAFAALAAVSSLTLAGAGLPKRKGAEPPPPKVEETVGDLAYIASNVETKLEGIGLVVNLDDTGADPGPSYYRQKLLDEMRKAQVERPNDLLKNPKVSMVVVTLRVPAGVSPSDRLDVEVTVPLNCATKSLAGGYLLETRLREVMVLGGTPKEGQDAALARGPVMVGSPDEPGGLKAGRVLGGGRVKKELPFQLLLKDNRKSIKTSALVESVVNQRFPQTEGVNQKGSATAKTDQYLVLKVPQIYHQNQDRYFRVIKLLPVVDSPALRVQRQALWSKELMDPTTAGVAALKLEGLGATAAEPLKAALASRNAQVRFFAAESLAYLNDPAGVQVLADTVRTYPEFRAYALAAFASMDQPASHMQLRKLMDEADVQIRYGAFNALRTLASDDPFLGQVRVLRDPVEPQEDPTLDTMAAAIKSPSRKPRPEDPFALYLVDCDGPPMIHVADSRRCEVVVFGREMRLLPPVVLGHGSVLLNASEGDTQLQISKIVPSLSGDRDAKVSSTFEMGDVLREVANLGANYPEVVSLLRDAAKQQNLPGLLVVDAVPAGTDEYLKAAFLGKDATKKDPALKRTKLDADAPPKRRSLLDRVLRRKPAAEQTAEPAAKPAPAKTPSADRKR